MSANPHRGAGPVYVAVGDVVRVILPSSEACMSMHVAERAMQVQILDGGAGPVAQLLNDDGSRYSFPILLGEAGIYEDEAGRLYVPGHRAIVTPERGVNGL